MKIETRTALISLIEPGIVKVDFKDDIEIDECDMRENIAASLTLTGGCRHSALLHTLEKDVSITHEGMRFGASLEATEHRIATAHLTNSMAGRIIGNFFMNYLKPKIRNRMFSDENEAIKWLRKFKSK